MKNNIKAEIVAHSTNKQGDEVISVLCTFPRIILAEVNTHRMLSKNTSSSRAIPFNKMVEAVKENPFIPIAWQKEHKGMQGTEYWDVTIEGKPGELNHTNIPAKWLRARDTAVTMAEVLHDGPQGITKQLCNRLLEPFMWTTMLITGSKEGWDNFFKLRCGVYSIHGCEEDEGEILDFKSKKEVISYYESKNYPMNKCYIGNNPYTDEERFGGTIDEMTDLDWLKVNKGMAEIHIMDLAEKIYDAVNESTPIKLKAGDWHIPFEKAIVNSNNWIDFCEKVRPEKEFGDDWENVQDLAIKSSVAMAARTSYTVVGEEKGMDYENMIALHDRLLTQDPPHSSPFEHCAKCLTDEEYETALKTVKGLNREKVLVERDKGWVYNLKGFMSYRYIVDNKLFL